MRFLLAPLKASMPATGLRPWLLHCRLHMISLACSLSRFLAVVR